MTKAADGRGHLVAATGQGTQAAAQGCKGGETFSRPMLQTELVLTAPGAEPRQTRFSLQPTEDAFVSFSLFSLGHRVRQPQATKADTWHRSAGGWSGGRGVPWGRGDLTGVTSRARKVGARAQQRRRGC